MNFDVPRFIYWTGVYNIGLTLGVALSAFGPIFGINFCSPAWALLIAGFLGFTANPGTAVRGPVPAIVQGLSATPESG